MLFTEKGVTNKKNDSLIEKGISPEKCAQDIIDGIMDQKKKFTLAEKVPGY